MSGHLLLLTDIESSSEGHIADVYRGRILAALRQAHEFGWRCDIEIRKHRSQRSLEQNAYLHAVPFPIIAEHVGDSIEGVKLDLMGECFGWKESGMSGHLYPVKPHTSSLTVDECTFFIEWLIAFAAQKFGLQIPFPNEVAA